MNQPLTKAVLMGLLGLAAFLSGCTTPLAPPTGKVVIPTPYGSNSRSTAGFYQSTVVPHNLESLVDHFRVYLRGTGGLADRPSFTVPFGQAAEFVFDNVPPGTYDLEVLAFQDPDETSFGPDDFNNWSVIGRGRMNGIVVNNGGVTITDLVTVTPINQNNGTFELTLKGIPSDVTGFSLDYKVVFVNPDGTLDIQPFGGPDNDSNGTLDYIENNTFPEYLETVGLASDGSLQQLTLKTNSGITVQTGTFFLQVKFKGSNGFYHSFQPLFTIQVFKNLKSTLEVNLDNGSLGEPLAAGELAPPYSLSTATDGTLAVTVAWQRTMSSNYISHYQIAQTADPDSNGPPTDAEILATVPNLNGVDSWATGVQLQDPALPKAKFWVRKIYSGMRPSNWASVVAGLGTLGGTTLTLPQVTISGPVATTAAQPVATFGGATSSNLVPVSSSWTVDGRTVQTNASASIDTLVLDTSSLSAGIHKILLKVTDSLGVSYSSAPYSLKVREVPTGKVAFSRYASSTYWLRPDGTLWAWGLNASGQLGDGTVINREFPVFISNNVADVSAGQSHVLVAKTDGTLWAAGSNAYGQRGNGTTVGGNPLAQVIVSGVPVTGVVAVASQQSGNFVLKADGTLWSAGYNIDGELGRATGVGDSTLTQVLSDVKQVQAGDFDAFALKTDGTLWATGRDFGANMLGLAVPGSVSTFTAVALTGTVTSFSAGRFDSFVVKDDGTLWATGANANGNQGNNGAINNGFLQVPGLSGVKAVSTGGYHTVLLMDDGTVRTAGSNNNGQLGIGSFSSDELLFQTVAGTQNVRSVTAGLGNTAFLGDTGLYLTGTNSQNQLGDGTTIHQSTPLRIDVGPRPLQIVSSVNRNFVIQADKTLWGAGTSSNGELGNGLTAYTVFTQVLGASTVASVATGNNHSLFVKTDGSVWGVGDSSTGQLGTQATTNTPVQLFGPGLARAVAAGNGYSLVLMFDGTVQASGLNTGGVLGLSDATTRTAFVTVPGVDRIVAMAAGSDYAFLLRSDGTLLAAGVTPGNDTNPMGFAGETNWQPHRTYTAVLTGVTRITTGDYFSAAVRSDGSLWVAGYNVYGQLGLGDTATRNAGFVQVVDSGVEDVSTGVGHTLFLRKNKTLWGMGYDAAVGSPGDPKVPTLIASEVQSFAAGGSFTYFTRIDGTLWWMGYDTTNSNGISGDQSFQLTPLRVVF